MRQVERQRPGVVDMEVRGKDCPEMFLEKCDRSQILSLSDSNVSKHLETRKISFYIELQTYILLRWRNSGQTW